MTTGPLLLAFRFQILRLARRRPCRPVRRHHLVSPGLLAPPQHPDQHRPENPVLLTVDQELGEGATLRVAPELSDPVGPLEVGQHQDVEQFGAGSRAEGVQAFAQPALQLVGSHGRRLRRPFALHASSLRR
jgi:hypothetical protein